MEIDLYSFTLRKMGFTAGEEHTTPMSDTVFIEYENRFNEKISVYFDYKYGNVKYVSSSHIPRSELDKLKEKIKIIKRDSYLSSLIDEG